MSTQTTTGLEGIPVHSILPHAKLIGAQSVNVTSCCGQWDECQPGDLFVAILEADSDGHDFCPQAIENGATAVITERLVATTAPQILVPDSRRAYAKVCHALAGSPSQRLSAIGISGSAGKTITTHLAHSILRAAGHTAGRSSSLGVVVGNDKPTIPHNELNPPMLCEQMAQMVLNGCTHAVVEVSARDLAKRKFEGVALDVAVLTNMRDDDIEFHSSRNNFKRSQLRILESLKSTGLAVLNLDDPTSHFLVETCTKPVLTFGMHHDANVRGQLLERLIGEQSFLVTTGTESVAVRSTIICV